MSKENLQAFFICPLSTPESKIRERSNRVKEVILESALGEKFDVRHADDFDDGGIIQQNIVEMLKNADLVIADLTDSNPNVLYELGVRHHTGRPTLLMKSKNDNKTKLPFDVNVMRVIFYPENHNVSELQECRQRIKNTADTLIEQYKIKRFCRNIAFQNPDMFFRILGRRTDEEVRKTMREAYERASEIDIFAMTGETSVENQEVFKSKLLGNTKTKIRILALSPKSNLVEARFRHIRNGDSTDFFAKANEAVDSYKKLCEEIKSDSMVKRIRTTESSLEFKQFDEIPYFSYVRCDNTIFLAVYTSSEITRNSFVFSLNTETLADFAGQLETHFDTIWKDSKTKTIVLIDSTTMR